jgi:hypothetical protein
MLDSPESVCAGQARREYPAISVPFGNVTCWHQAAVWALDANLTPDLTWPSRGLRSLTLAVRGSGVP